MLKVNRMVYIGLLEHCSDRTACQNFLANIFGLFYKFIMSAGKKYYDSLITGEKAETNFSYYS